MSISKREDWGTPAWLFDELDDCFKFDLDAAASADNALCRRYISKDRDALHPATPWDGQRIWVNPPYGRGLFDWVQRAYQESLRPGCPMVALLLPVRADTKWFHNYVYPACLGYHATGSVIWIDGRLTFEGAAANAPFPSFVVLFNARHTWRLSARGRGHRSQG